MEKSIRNIGILSHVDAGKTTITEQFLFLGGMVKVAGDVNKGSTVTDYLEIEKARGVSVKAADVSFEWKGCRINLIDTPGHADFSAEVERSLQIMDGAILVISAVEGLQPHTWALWDALKRRGIPVIFFINKIDRAGSGVSKVIDAIEKEFRIKTFAMTAPLKEEATDAGIVETLSLQDPEEGFSFYEHAMENLSDLDGQVMEKYLDGEEFSRDELISKIQTYLNEFRMFPLLVGAAKFGRGIPALLDAVVRIFPDAKTDTGNLSALVYKVRHDPVLGRLAFIRLFDGQIRVRDQVLNLRTGNPEKVAQIKKKYTGKLQDLAELACGDTGIITGLPDVVAGDILGSSHRVPPSTKMQIPIMTVQVKPDREENFTPLAHALETLNLEDPALNFRWFKDEQELHLSLMGKIQTEILESELRDRFGLEAIFSNPNVIYKETPDRPGNGFASYTMPKPCWAVVNFAIEPGKPGSGIVYESRVSFDKIKQKYQNEIEAVIPKSLDQGIKGWEVTDIKITLIDGEDHEIHSRPGDWNIAVPMAIMNGLTQTGTTLLEPVLAFVITAPEELLGQIAGDLHKMRGTFESPVFDTGRVAISGKVPAATSMDYGIRLGTHSGGRAQIMFSFDGYQPVPDSEGVIRPYKGVNPMDRSRWILHNRGAFKAEERRG